MKGIDEMLRQTLHNRLQAIKNHKVIDLITLKVKNAHRPNIKASFISYDQLLTNIRFSARLDGNYLRLIVSLFSGKTSMTFKIRTTTFLKVVSKLDNIARKIESKKDNDDK